MSGFHDNALIGASGQQGYQINRSLRFRSSASAYLSRTFGTPTNNKIWTYSVWMKRGSLSANRTIMSSNVDGAEYWDMRFNTSDQILIQNRVGSSNLLFANTTAVYRDPSAWYHIVFVFDSDNATPANRNLLYVNNVNVSLSANSGSGNASAWNTSGVQHNIGVSRTLTTGGGIWAEFDGYETEINFIDGQALTPASFGETNPVTGVWQPKKYAGTYGTNGFYLNFSDNSAATAATIGKDYSGNSNDWTPNNISVTAGVTYDSMIDVPTQWADGGNGRGNYCTLNPLDTLSGTITEGNLAFTSPATGYGGTRCTVATPTTGKWYWEVTINAITGGFDIGISSANEVRPVVPGESSASYGYKSDGAKRTNFADTIYGAAYTTNDVIGVALDLDAGTLVFYKNNTSQGTAFSSLSGGFLPMVSDFSNSAVSSAYINFGQRPFAYTPPTGFKALNTLNLPEPTISNGAQYMAATTYTGNGTTQSISNAVNGVSFQPDFVWFKNRSGANNHALYDSVRGRALGLISNATNAEQSASAGNDLVSFDSNGVSLGPVEDFTSVNGSAQSIVAWQWKANGTPAVTNTAGSITSQVSAGANQGFSIVTWSGSGAAGTIGHGLNAVPAMLITKKRTSATDSNWVTWHKNFTGGNTVTDAYYMYLNGTNGQNASGGVFYKGTDITSTTFGFQGGNANVNASGQDYVAYCFAAVAGYSAFGSYTGNGSADGPFCFTGFLPRWVMIKRTDSTGDWYIWDTARNTFNLMTQVLFADLSAAESTYAAPNPVIDVLSNGFKQRGTYPHNNASGGTYIFAAFAESPFKVSLAR